MVQEKHFMRKEEENQLIVIGFYYTCLSQKDIKAFD